jgi:hypothetical protein
MKQVALAAGQGAIASVGVQASGAVLRAASGTRNPTALRIPAGEGTEPRASPTAEALPSGVGGTRANYNKATGQGLYVLREESGTVRYVGRGDVPARLASHAETPGKENLIGEALWTNNLTDAQAKGLENRLMNFLGGPHSQNPETPLLNKIRAYSPANPAASTYDRGATGSLWEETLRRLGSAK